jgi:hypothetical protein
MFGPGLSVNPYLYDEEPGSMTPGSSFSCG